MLTVRNLHIEYNSKTIVRDLSFQVADGEVVCLRGESGCGKTSILRAVLGYIDYSGTIELDSAVMNERTTAGLRQQIAYVPQEFVMPFDTVGEMIHSVMDLRANSLQPCSKDLLMTAWSQLALDPSLYDKQARELSGGQRQRIMLSIAGMLRKRLLLVDEPTSALDADTTRLVAQYIHRLAHEQHIPVLAVSHSDIFAQQCNKIIDIP